MNISNVNTTEMKVKLQSKIAEFEKLEGSCLEQLSGVRAQLAQLKKRMVAVDQLEMIFEETVQPENTTTTTTNTA